MDFRAKHQRRPGRYIIGIAVFFLFLVVMVPATKSWFGDQDRPPATWLRTPADPKIAASLVARMVDSQATREQRQKAYAELCAMESGDVRDNAFLEAVRRAPEDVAVSAAASMLCEETPASEEIDRIVEQRLPTWSVGSQSLLLPPNFGCSQRESATLRFIPRAILRDLLERGKERLEGLYGAIGTSGRLLATSEDPQDKELLAQAVLFAPEIPGLWWNLAELGAVGPEQRKLARAIVEDPEYPFHRESQVKEDMRRMIRVAAAAALSPNKSTDEFAIGEIRAYLSEFSNGEMNRSNLPERIQGALLEKLDRYKWSLGLLRNLMYLQTPAAREVTLEYLNCPDHMIRRTLAVVTARRWPERLLQLDAADFVEDHGANSFDIFLAIAAFYHPELEEELLLKGSPAMIRPTLDGLRRGGLWGLRGEAGVVVGEW